MLTRLITFSAICASMVTCAGAAVVFSENFDSIAPTSPGSPAGLNAAGWYFRNTSTSGAFWNSGGSTRSFTNGVMTGNSLFNNGGSSGNTVLLKQWTPITLDEIGESLTVSFNALVTNASLSGTFNVSLLSTSNVVSTNTFGNSGLNASPIAGATGYGYLQTASAGGINTVSESSSGTTNTLKSSPTILPVLNDSIVHSYSLSVAKVSTGFEVSFSRDGGIIHSFIDTSNTGNLTLSTLKLGPVQTIAIDNVVLSSSLIPEPSTYAALGGLSVLVLAVARRRRR
jgi:hypothetical protein